MIVRAWRGRATPENAEAYVGHLRESVFPKLGGMDGHEGALLLRRDGAGGVEFLVLTLWASMEAVTGFAGEDPGKAVVEPAARAVLADFDTTVAHYEVVLKAIPETSRLTPRG
jgi:heme-degrading monooxygenase HmoA